MRVKGTNLYDFGMPEIKKWHVEFKGIVKYKRLNYAVFENESYIAAVCENGRSDHAPKDSHFLHLLKTDIEKFCRCGAGSHALDDELALLKEKTSFIELNGKKYKKVGNKLLLCKEEG